jgi:hypothetical protein
VSKLLSGLACGVMLLVSSISAFGTVYYIDATNGNDSANGTTLSTAWQTINKANSTLQAGDTVYIRAGSYTNGVVPSRTGTSEANRITYSNYNGEKVAVSNSTYAVFINGKSYITITGLDFSYMDRFLYIGYSANHNIIGYCSFNQMRTYDTWAGSRLYSSSQYNRIHHCTFSRYVMYTTDDLGTDLDIGSENSTNDFTFYNLIEDNVMYYGGHHVFAAFGSYNVVRNNYIHNEEWYNGYGDRCAYASGHIENSGRNLFEGNRIAYSSAPCPTDGDSASGLMVANCNHIFRHNLFYYNNTCGLMFSYCTGYIDSPKYNHVYNNTFFHNGTNTLNLSQEKRCGLGFSDYDVGYSVVSNIVKNNIFRSNRDNRSIGVYHVNLSDQVITNNWEEAGDPLFVDVTAPVDHFNQNLFDLHLQPGSPCIDKGGFLTKVTSSSGSGTTFAVADAGYFMDGWGIVEGDVVQLQGGTQRAKITHVDYSNNTITVDSSLTWTQNLGISLAYEGSAPDQGAYEYAAQTSPVEVIRILETGVSSGSTPGCWFNWCGGTNATATNTFKVYRSTNLLYVNWQLVAPNVLRSGNGTNLWTDTNVFRQAFYRVATPNQ